MEGELRLGIRAATREPQLPRQMHRPTVENERNISTVENCGIYIASVISCEYI